MIVIIFKSCIGKWELVKLLFTQGRRHSHGTHRQIKYPKDDEHLRMRMQEIARMRIRYDF